jgi:predicted ATPase/DNA-binding XRE family transcriptional regulator
MDAATELGQWLRARRRELDLTQAGLASLAGCSESSIRKFEAGTLRPSRQVAELLAERLGVPDAGREDFVRWARSGPGTPPPATIQVQPAPPPPPKRPQVGALPVPPTPIVGREAEAEALLEMLRDGTHRLISLTGPPGTGKTRLAVHVVTQAAREFRDGARFVALASITDPDLVPATIARALGLSEASGPPILEQVIRRLSEAEMLLVLDNFEQIVPAAPLVADIMAEVPGCKFIVTSRESLHLRGEQIYPVPPLGLPSPPELQPAALLGAPAVALFVQRAREIDPTFALTEENAADVAAICYRVEGLPLAIELAAARIAIFPPPALLARLETRLPLLTDGPRDLPHRQRTMRNAVGSSYDLLDAPEQHLFRVLSVFRDGFTVQAANEVCDCATDDPSAEMVERVSSLRAKSLLRLDFRSEEQRFIMLEMIREYAAEKLEESGEQGEVRRRHAQYFLKLVEEAEPLIQGGRQNEWLDRLEAEHANLRAALAWAFSSDSEGVETGARLCLALNKFFLRRGHWTEGRRATDVALDRLDRALPDAQGEQAQRLRELRARLLHFSGMMAYRQGDYTVSNERLGASIELWRSLGTQPARFAEVLQDVATLSVLRDEYDQADRALSEALHIHRGMDNKQGMASVLNLLGFLAMVLGQFDRSEAFLREAVDLFDEMGDQWGTARTEQMIAVVARNRGDFATAEEYLGRTLEASNRLGNKSGTAAALGEMSLVALAQGKLDRAEELNQEVMGIYESLGGVNSWTQGKVVLGLIALYRGRLDEAAGSLRSALATFHEEHARYDQGTCLMALAGVAAASGRGRRAARLMGASEAVYRRLGANMDYFGRTIGANLSARLEATLGPQQYAEARSQGHDMEIERAYEYAMETAAEYTPGAAASPNGSAPSMSAM